MTGLNEELTHTETDWPKPGDIVLFENAKGIAKLIPLVTRSPFYHVAIYSGENKVIEARPQGVIERDQCDPIGGPFDAFVSMPEDQAKSALQWAREQIGKRYDSFGLLVLLFERVFRNLRINYAPPNRYTCGEFVVTAFRQAGASLLSKLEASEVEPADLAKLPLRRVTPPCGALPSHGQS